MSHFNLLYATKVNIGGWATFTVHLVHLLEAAGHTVDLLKIGANTEPFTRPFGEHGVRYQNIAAGDLVARCITGADHSTGPTIIAALGKHYVEDVKPLIAKGAGVVVHDTAESTNRMEEVRRPWVIRKKLAEYFDEAVFIRHPYVRHDPAGADYSWKGRRGFYATSRVDFDKNTTMILDANRLGAGISIVGFENRLYTKFKVMPEYPEWVQSPGTHPRSGSASFELLQRAKGMVDLTDIKGDGGGTQYTFLEAWDAGAIPIIGRWWIDNGFKGGDDMVDGKNCVAISDAEELARVVRTHSKRMTPEMMEAGWKALKRHSPKVVAPQVLDWLNSL